MIINKTYKFKLNPTKDQKISLIQQSGNSRFIWNKLTEFNLNFQKVNGKFPTQSQLQKQIVIIKNEFPFAKSTYSQPIQVNAKRMHEVNKKTFKKDIVAKRNTKIAKAKKSKNKNRIKKALIYGFTQFKKNG